jgi:hypothetical protein
VQENILILFMQMAKEMGEISSRKAAWLASSQVLQAGEKRRKEILQLH